MNIVYVIFNIKFGKGGHFHSLLETASKVKEKETITVISLGKYRSPVLDKLGDDYHHIETNSIITMMLQLQKMIKKLQPNVINSFDAQSYFFVRLLSNFLKIPAVLTRCGGPNPKNYYPFCKDMILFSEENRIHFSNVNKFSLSNLHVVPNRVPSTSYNQDYNSIKFIKSKLRPDALILLRIARISLAYEKSISQSINLVNKLAGKGIDAQLVLVGVIENENVFSKLKQRSNDNVLFFTQNELTLNSSKLIDVADVVIGTGRSFMEGALLNKVMMVPSSNIDVPDLVDISNVFSAFEVNFSQRFYSNRNSELIVSKFVNNEIDNDKEELKDFYIRNFSSDKLHERLMPIYRDASVCDLKILDTIKNMLFLVRYKSLYVKKWFDFLIRMRK
ncbi:glycosyltransferase [Vibrio splendidus]